MIREKIEKIAFKGRGALWGVFALCVLLFPCSFDLFRLFAGLFFVLAGQALRFWAAGYIPEYRTENIGAPELITWGPYKWVRNPLYSSNFVMGFGWSLMLGYEWVVAFTLAFVVLYMFVIIPAEERFLEGKFGALYSDYKKNVPALFPYPRAGFPAITGKERPFDRNASKTREIYSVFINVPVTLIIFAKLHFLG